MLTLAEYRTYKNVTATTYDALVTALIPVVQDMVENYCDRVFVTTSNTEWKQIDQPNSVLLDNYPVNRLQYIGFPEPAVTITDTTDLTLNITTSATALYVTDSYGVAETEFLYSAYATLGALKTAVEADNANISFSINSGFSAYPSTLLQPSVNGTVLYIAERYDVTYELLDNRTILIKSYGGFPGPYYHIFVKYTSGWATADIPKAIKYAMCNIISDYVAQTGTDKFSGSYKSETIGDYSYTNFDTVKLQDIFSNYADTLDFYRKRFV